MTGCAANFSGWLTHLRTGVSKTKSVLDKLHIHKNRYRKVINMQNVVVSCMGAIAHAGVPAILIHMRSLKRLQRLVGVVPLFILAMLMVSLTSFA